MVKHAVLSVQSYFRHLRFKLPRAWDCVRSWQATRAFKSRVPISFDVLRYLFAVGLSWALEEPGKACWLLPLIVLMRVSFFGLLRPGEACRLVSHDVRFFGAESETKALLALRRPKTMLTYARSQFTVVEDISTVDWLEWLCSSLPAGCKLFPANTTGFAKWRGLLLGRASLKGYRVTPGSLRAGGATYMIMTGMDMGRLQFRGRWLSERSLASYVQEAVCFWIWAQLPSEEQRRVEEGARASETSWLHAPRAPWHSYFNRGRQWTALRQLGRKSRGPRRL